MTATPSELIRRRARRARLEFALEEFIVMWLMVTFMWALVQAFMLMLLLGAMHGVEPTVPAIGFWTCLGISYPLLLIIRIIVLAVLSATNTRKRWEMRRYGRNSRLLDR